VTILPLFFIPDGKLNAVMSELDSCGNSRSLHQIWSH